MGIKFLQSTDDNRKDAVCYAAEKGILGRPNTGNVLFGCLKDLRTGKTEIRNIGKNVIVDVAGKLFANLSIQFTAGSGIRISIDGIRTLAVGTGGIGWDLQNPPAETSAQTYLESELERNAFDSVTYIDGSGNETSTRTNIIDLTTTYGDAEAVGALCEMALFGGPNSLLSNQGLMVNYKTFPVWNKPTSSTLTFVWRLTF